MAQYDHGPSIRYYTRNSARRTGRPRTRSREASYDARPARYGAATRAVALAGTVMSPGQHAAERLLLLLLVVFLGLIPLRRLDNGALLIHDDLARLVALLQLGLVVRLGRVQSVIFPSLASQRISLFSICLTVAPLAAA